MEPKVTKIDGVNYVRRTVPTANGPIELEGITARALIKALQTCDPDDLICYMAEMTEECKASPLIIGVIGGIAAGADCGASFLVGPEVSRAMRVQGKI